MKIETPGKVTDRIWLLGRRESCVYLLKGRQEYALVGGGMIPIVPDVMDQLKVFAIEEEMIRRIVILHSHFDHCGIVPFFKKRWPWARVTASERAKDLFSFPDVIEAIEFLNQMSLIRYRRENAARDLELSFSGIDVEEAVKDGDVLSCDGLSMEIIGVPGHSSCSIAVYVPEEKAMFASDAGGVPFGDRIFTAANSNFDLYQQGLKKMARYKVNVFLAEHFGARIGEDGRGFLQRSMVSARETRAILEDSYASTQDVKKSTEEITEMLMKGAPESFFPREVVAMVTEQMLKYIAGQMST